MAQSTESEFFHAFFILHELLADLAFHAGPYLLVGIEVRRIWRQVEQFERTVKVGDVFLD